MTDRIIKILILVVMLMVFLFNNISWAAQDENESSFVFSAVPDKTEVEPGGEEVIIELKVSDINLGEHGMNVVGGYLFYDNKFFSDMELINVNDWEITYNNEEGKRNGKFLIVKMVDGIHEDETICKIKVTVNKDLTEGEGKVILKEIQSNDGEKLVDQGNRTVIIKIKKPSDVSDPKAPEDEPEDPEKPSDPKDKPKDSEKQKESEKSVDSENKNLVNNSEKVENIPQNNISKETKKSQKIENVRTEDNIMIPIVIIILIISLNYIIKKIIKNK